MKISLNYLIIQKKGISQRLIKFLFQKFERHYQKLGDNKNADIKYFTPSAINSVSIEPLSVLQSKLKFEW